MSEEAAQDVGCGVASRMVAGLQVSPLVTLNSKVRETRGKPSYCDSGLWCILHWIINSELD